MFEKLVAIEPVSLIPSAEEQLRSYAKEVVMYRDIPADTDEMARRIGDADAVLLSYTSKLGSGTLKHCPKVKYIGMACSLYSSESANVDIRYANSQGIAVTGIRDYGDEGVVEYVLSELIRRLHGFGIDQDGSPVEPWDGVPREITGLKVGVVGLGKSGGMVADALHFLGADIVYFSRTKKQWADEKGYRFLALDKLLSQSEVIITCLNRNTVLLHEAEFSAMGNRKILFNTGLSPAWDEAPFAKWIANNNLCYCDTIDAAGGAQWLQHPHIRCMQVSSGRTRQAFDRLSEKVLANISGYLKTQ